MTGVVFKLPIVRQIYTMCRAGNVSKRNFTRSLEARKDVVFIPGGVQEVLLLKPDDKKVSERRKTTAPRPFLAHAAARTCTS